VISLCIGSFDSNNKIICLYWSLFSTGMNKLMGILMHENKIVVRDIVVIMNSCEDIGR
jgi:hypothetical protein